jgi:hypothetical protein
MATRPRVLVEMEYDEAAEEYLRSLTLENLAESYKQGTQREKTLASFAVVKTRRPDVHVFNEMLVQYPNPDKNERRKRQVVPDNMIILHEGPLKVGRIFNLPLQPCRPFWVMEYVSKTNKRKDYDESMFKYEHELKVPYYLLFVPEEEELTLYRHSGRRYRSVKPNDDGRYAVPELEMEIGLREGWVRYWHRGTILPLPADLVKELDEARQQIEAANRRAELADHRAAQEARRAEQAEAEVARLRAMLAEQEKRAKRT